MEEVIIVGIIFGCIVATVAIIAGIFKDRYKVKNASLMNNEDFLKALREFKEKTDKRLTRLESAGKVEDHFQNKKSIPDKGSVTLPNNKEETTEQTTSDTGSLRNMLKD